jgi:hypothetical protein
MYWYICCDNDDEFLKKNPNARFQQDNHAQNVFEIEMPLRGNIDIYQPPQHQP